MTKTFTIHVTDDQGKRIAVLCYPSLAAANEAYDFLLKTIPPTEAYTLDLLEIFRHRHYTGRTKEVDA